MNPGLLIIHRRSPGHLGNQRGVALVLALLMLALLIALILEFDAEARRELREASAFRDGLRATTLSRSGIHAVRAILKEDIRLKQLGGTAHDGLNDLWTRPFVNYPLGDGLLSATIEDERAKLNLNMLANQPDPLARRAKIDQFKRLFELLNLDPRLVDPIVDWVDTDSEPEPDGAEASYYETLRPPYRPANEPLKTFAELSLVKGMTDSIVQKLARYVTVYPLGGEAWININTADPLVIQALDPGLSLQIVQDVITARPFRTIQEVDQVSSFESTAKKLRLAEAYQVRSDHFSARMTITINEVSRTARTVIQRDNTSGESSTLYFRVE